LEDDMGRPCSKKRYALLVGKPKGKRPLGRLRHKWVDNIETNLGGTG
jgi:hypothetical protein